MQFAARNCRATRAKKINIATIGNVVSQFLMHLIARHADDEAWPAPVWGHGALLRFRPPLGLGGWPFSRFWRRLSRTPEDAAVADACRRQPPQVAKLNNR